MDEKILALIREQRDYISGEEISKELGISRAGIWKHIEKLRSLGYEIEASPHLGYRFISAPDKLIPEEVSWKLNTRILGGKIYSFARTDSTNTLAYNLAEKGEPQGSIVFAEEQTKGRGRFNRAWQSRAGGIYMSVILRPRIEPARTARITLAASVAVAEAVIETTRLAARIKWPNDILVNGKKVCGILTEMKAQQDETDFVVLGIGINVNNSPDSLPSTATSLRSEAGKDILRVSLARKILELFEPYYLKVDDGFDDIIRRWRGLADTLGKRVKVHAHNQQLEGQAMDVDENGALLLRLDSGFNKHILSGDVELVR
ncbi:MAG: biotin--[acetyl-CoA-carboxylase] ligase [Candidatus Omnitrophica bacterium]|nr:biotin--[acetyl-CoA-carboxylase] ligase [Candidatus Omnitrophota bacterium]